MEVAFAYILLGLFVASIIKKSQPHYNRKAERILETGVKGTAKLYRCLPQFYRTRIVAYELVVLFYYDGEYLYRSPGTCTTPPCDIGDKVDIIYSPSVDKALLYQDYKERFDKIHERKTH